MNKQFQGSKKKGRKKEWLEREAKRAKAIESGHIEEIAKVMGIKLR